MSDHAHNQGFPKTALLAVTALIGFSLAAVLLAKFTGAGVNNSVALDKSVPGQIQVRDLRFEDRENGLVEVIDAENQTHLFTLQPGTENFIRGVLRGLVRERRSMNLGDESAFRLIRKNNGELFLVDLATKRSVYLNAFGQTNVNSFARLMSANEY